MGESVLKEAPSARFARNSPVDQLVERDAEGSRIPPADFTQDVARKLRSDVRRDFRGAARVGRKLFDAACDERVEILRRERPVAFAVVVDELGNE